MDIVEKLFELQDLGYRDFSSALIPNVEKELVIGVRTPQLRKLAKELFKSGEAESFMTELPHKYLEENHLHGFLIEQIKDFDACIAAINKFLHFINNWATCDSMRPKVFAAHKAELIGCIEGWIGSEHCYTKRFGIEMLMCHFLDGDFCPQYLSWANIKSDEYYLNMMCAWFYATALAKQYDATIGIFEQKVLPPWVHNKAIQKARESFRVSKEHKDYLKNLKI